MFYRYSFCDGFPFFVGFAFYFVFIFCIVLCIFTPPVYNC
jgi:hypothetical protein